MNNSYYSNINKKKSQTNSEIKLFIGFGKGYLLKDSIDMKSSRTSLAINIKKVMCNS